MKTRASTNQNLENIYNIVPLFATPVFYKKLEVTEDLVKSTENIKYIDTENKTGLISKNNKILYSKKFKPLLKKLQKEIDFYVYNVLHVSNKIKFKIGLSWVMKHEHGNYSHTAPAHFHTGSILSGCFYIKAKKDCGNIIFSDSNSIYVSKALPFPLGFRYSQLNTLNASSWEFGVEDGLLIIFPSSLMHSTNPNLGETDRYCLAFDVILDGEFGLIADQPLKIKMDV